jgi:hypothetical protein
MSPVKAPAASAANSCPPIMMVEPRAVAKSATSVAGGHTAMSIRAASSRAPAMILARSAAERCQPFIFQLPATRGRRALAISRSRQSFPPFSFAASG